MSNMLGRLFAKLFPKAVPPLSAEEQQRRGRKEWHDWHKQTEGKTFMFGEMHRAYDEIKAKYPLWDMTIGDGNDE